MLLALFFFFIEYIAEKNVTFQGGLSGKIISSQLMIYSPKRGKIFHLALTLIIPYDEKSSSISA